jgi:hypothetical protein
MFGEVKPIQSKDDVIKVLGNEAIDALT